MAHKSIEAVVARLEKQNGLSLGHSTCPEEVFVEASPGMDDMDSLEEAAVPRALYEELLRNYQQQQEEMRHLQQELERTRRQLVQQAKKLKEYGALVSEMKELRDLNRRLQDVLLLRLGSGECPAGHCAREPRWCGGSSRRVWGSREGWRLGGAVTPRQSRAPPTADLRGAHDCRRRSDLEHGGDAEESGSEKKRRQCLPPLMHSLSKRQHQGLHDTPPRRR